MQIKCIRILVQLCTNTKDVHTFFYENRTHMTKFIKKSQKRKRNKFWGKY